jgi:4-hydroxy-tetrahydrodipicolinate reductase
MGNAVARVCFEADDIEIVAAICRDGSPLLGRDLGELAGVGARGVLLQADVAAGLRGADVVIDFSTASAVDGLLRAAVEARVPVVSGTTGIEGDVLASLDVAARSIAVLWARNMSLGVYVLTRLVEQAARALGPDFDIEIAEIHHRRKIDAPSGTARLLADAVTAALPRTVQRWERAGMAGPRLSGELGVVALRGGDVIGDHTVYLLGDGERLELTHRATSRDVFAPGAIRAARWLIGRPAGRYTFGDVLNLQ